RDVDVLALGREGNARFVAGVTRLLLAGTRPLAPRCVVVRAAGARRPMGVTPARGPPEVPPPRVCPMSREPRKLAESPAAITGVSDAASIGVDGITPLFDQLLAARFPNAELADGEEIMRVARRVKTPAEIECIRTAVSVAEDAFGVVVGALHAGARESDLKGVLEERMAQLGTTAPAFEGVFCVVDGDCPIRRFVSDRTIADGDLVAMNAGVLVDGWEGSLARTWPVDPRPEHRLRCARWRTEW